MLTVPLLNRVYNFCRWKSAVPWEWCARWCAFSSPSPPRWFTCLACRDFASAFTPRARGTYCISRLCIIQEKKERTRYRSKGRLASIITVNIWLLTTIICAKRFLAVDITFVRTWSKKSINFLLRALYAISLHLSYLQITQEYTHTEKFLVKIKLCNQEAHIDILPQFIIIPDQRCYLYFRNWNVLLLKN